jgi:hypothetical protein
MHVLIACVRLTVYRLAAMLLLRVWRSRLHHCELIVRPSKTAATQTILTGDISAELIVNGTSTTGVNLPCTVLGESLDAIDDGVIGARQSIESRL